MKIALIYIGIAVVMITAAYFIGRHSANSDARIQQAEAKAKLYELKAKRFEDSTTYYRGRASMFEKSVLPLTRKYDSLERVKQPIINRMTILPVPTYKPKQLDSVWRAAYKDEL